MQKTILLIAALLGALSVGIGAFGAHGLKAILLANDRLDTFETAVKYQFYHTLAIFLIGLLMNRVSDSLLPYAAFAMLLGILFFSGSLYILSLTNTGAWGAVTPIGGLFMIIGWTLLAVAIAKANF
jgi:uncharacterized membrane protein YgdD (TMEM256/DUF423 family)